MKKSQSHDHRRSGRVVVLGTPGGSFNLRLHPCQPRHRALGGDTADGALAKEIGEFTGRPWTVFRFEPEPVNDRIAEER